MTKINGANFTVFATDGAESMQRLVGHAYRTFHRNKCYQLEINIVLAYASVFEPPAKELPKEDWDDVNNRLKECLNSFRFLK